MKYRIMIVLLCMPLLSSGQYKSRGDSLLMNERTMDRPVIVHKGQFRTTTQYTFAILNSRFDNDGEKIKLDQQGNIGISHRVNLTFDYGILEILSLRAGLSYQASNQRAQPVFIFVPDNSVSINEISEFTGFEDFSTGLDFLFPWTGPKLDIALHAGMSLPTADYEPDQPSHSIQTFSDGNESSTEVNYLYNENLGLGVSTVVAGGQVKYRWTDLAISGRFSYRLPTEESESVSWSQRLVGNNEFEYSSKTFAYQPSEEYFAAIQMEYQLYPFVNLFLDVEYLQQSGGWTEESDRRLQLPELQLTTVGAGTEILLTSRFWLRQRMLFGILGKNSFSPIGVETGLIYNLFPF